MHEVQRRGEFEDRAAAEDAVLATLSVLGERLKGGEAKDLAAQLPAELAEALPTDGPGERFDVMEFVRRVAAREARDVSTPIAKQHARVVLAVVLGSISPRRTRRHPRTAAGRLRRRTGRVIVTKGHRP